MNNDTLTVKFQLEVKMICEAEASDLPNQLSIKLPASTISANFLSMLESGQLSDVTFLVEGHTIRAHSQILSARSEIFSKTLNSGMTESLSKRS